MSSLDDKRIGLPAWLPWATTACLAALVACLVELWMIEKARNQLLKDEGLLSQSAMQGMGNQLEAERIISERQIERLRPGSRPHGALRVALLAAQGRGAAAMGAVAWNASDGTGEIRVSGLAHEPPERDCQLWLEGRGQLSPSRCAVFHCDSGGGGAEIHVDPASAAEAGGRFVLIDGVHGGSGTLEEAKAGGSIVLATPVP